MFGPHLLWSVLVLPLNMIHIMFYLKHQSIIRITAGMLMMIVPVFIRPLMLVLNNETLNVAAIMIYLVYGIWVTKRFIVVGNFSEVGFTVFSVLLFGNMFQLLISASLLVIFPNAQSGEDVAVGSVILVVLYTLSLPMLYRYARVPFARMLSSVRQQPWYLACMTPASFVVLALFVKELLFSPPHDLLSITIAFVTVFVTISAYTLLYASITQRSRNQLLLEQLHTSEKLMEAYRHYDEEINAREKKIRTINHDFRHMVAHLTMLAEESNALTVSAFLATLHDTDDDIIQTVYCDNKAVSAMVSFYFSLTRKNGSACEAKLDVPAKTVLKETELLTLVGNALENCVKATEAMGKTGYIRVGGKIMGDMLVLKFSNNFEEAAYRRGQRLGQSSIRMICEQYGGVMKTETNGNEYMLSVMMKICGDVPASNSF